MSQDNQHPCDRDCLIAATLAVAGIEGNRSGSFLVERFGEMLKAIHKAGGTYQMWADAQKPDKGQPGMIG